MLNVFEGDQFLLTELNKNLTLLNCLDTDERIILIWKETECEDVVWTHQSAP
jgi:hypothetical protein